MGKSRYLLCVQQHTLAMERKVHRMCGVRRLPPSVQWNLYKKYLRTFPLYAIHCLNELCSHGVPVCLCMLYGAELCSHKNTHSNPEV